MTAVLSILYVEDEADIAEIAKIALEELGGHTVLWCPSGEAAIAQVADLSRADLARAIDGAEAAQKKWAALTAKERCNILRK